MVWKKYILQLNSFPTRSVQTLLQLFLYESSKTITEKKVSHSRWYFVQLLSSTHRSTNILFQQYQQGFLLEIYGFIVCQHSSEGEKLSTIAFRKLTVKTQRANVVWVIVEIFDEGLGNDGRKRRRRKVVRYQCAWGRFFLSF